MLIEFFEWHRELSTIQSLFFGLVATAISYMLLLFFWNGIVSLALKTKSRYDDEIVLFLKPIIRYGTVLIGISITVQTSLEAYNDVRQILSKLMLIACILIVSSSLNRTIDRNLPKIFATIDSDKEIGLSRSANMISSLTKVAVWLTAFLLTLTMFDIEITAAVASLTVFSLVIGMALQESASNMIVSGQLMIDSPYDIGDKIEINGQVGVVTEIGVLSTKVRTPGEQLMVIPNKTMASSTITNFARGGSAEHPARVNLRIDVGVGYDESPEHVKNVIRDILAENDEVMKEPKPLILLTDMLDSALLFRINTFVDNYQNEWVVRDQILTAIIHRFAEEGIEIPYPHMKILKEEQSVPADRKKLERIKKAERDEAVISEQLIHERNEIKFDIDELRSKIADDSLSAIEIEHAQQQILELESKLFINED